MKTVAVVGSNGIPAKYGGFETLAENLVRGSSQECRFIVYCSNVHKEHRQAEFLGARLIHVPISANGWQTLFYDAITTLHAFFCADVILILGPSFGFVLPLNLLFRRNIVINYGGLNEWDRSKYSKIQRLYIRATYFLATKFASVNIADNELLKINLASAFGISSKVIRYGGDHVTVQEGRRDDFEAKHPFLRTPYFASVSRAQADNNIHLLIDAFRQLPDQTLVIISNWNVSEYGRNIRQNFNNIANIILLDAIYDSVELNYIRAHSRAYIHTHSYCGTAPSLVEAICLGLPIISFDVPTNRETTNNQALYFQTPDELASLVRGTDTNALRDLQNRMEPLRLGAYRWTEICGQYEQLFLGPNQA